MGIHEHPQADRLRAARSIGAAPLLAAKPTSPLADHAIAVAVGAIAVMAAIIFVGLIAGFYAITLAVWAIARPAFWLGIVAIAVLAHLAGWWP